MTTSWKQRLALQTHRFLSYWTAKAMKSQPLVHPTVYVMPNVYIAPQVAVGRYTYIRGGAQLESGAVGAFCSIAPNVLIGGDEHPLDAASTHPFWYTPGGLTVPGAGPAEQSSWTQPKQAPVIGNDVWIGAGAQVLRGAVIEDGAVIGAGAIVTGRIPAYAIAVGVPARVVKYRFDEGTIARLRQSQWWNWEEAKLVEKSPLFRSADDLLGESGQPSRQKGEAV